MGYGPWGSSYEPYDPSDLATTIVTADRSPYEPWAYVLTPDGPTYPGDINLGAMPSVEGGGGGGELPEVTVTAQKPPEKAVAPVAVTGGLLTSGQLLEELLKRPNAPPPPTDFEQLLKKPPPSEFEKLLQKPRLPVLEEVVVKGKKFVPTISRLARVAGPAALLLLLPDMLKIGESLDDAATDSWLRRLQPRNDARRAPRKPAADPGGSRGAPDLGLPEVTITGRAPHNSRPSVPLLLPVGVGTGVSTQPLLTGFTAPEVLNAPSPSPRPKVLPQPLPRVQLDPSVPGLDLPQPKTTRPSPLPTPTPVPLSTAPNLSGCPPCDCKKTRTKNKPRKPRDVCWKGTYLETARGLSKTRRVRVDCSTGRELADSPAASPPPKRSTHSGKTVGDLATEVFKLPRKRRK